MAVIELACEVDAAAGSRLSWGWQLSAVRASSGNGLPSPLINVYLSKSLMLFVVYICPIRLPLHSIRWYRKYLISYLLVRFIVCSH